MIFRQSEFVADGRHFGSRLLFTPDKELFIRLGDRSKRDEPSSLHGKIVRVEMDGAAAADNPFAFRCSTRNLESWTSQRAGLAFSPATGELGNRTRMQGGDELNVIEQGHNYGWPVISYGCEYGSCAQIGEGAEAGLDQPVTY